MSWVKLDHAMPSHPKMLGLTAGEFALFIEALCYCSQHETDGILPQNAGKTMRFWTEKRSKTLQERSLWKTENDGGNVVLRIHDYLDYQPSKANLQAERAATRDRVANWRKRRSNSVTDEEVTVLPALRVTEPRPVPSLREDFKDQEDSTDDHVLSALLKVMGEPSEGQARVELQMWRAKGASEHDFRAVLSGVEKARPKSARAYVRRSFENRLREKA